MGPDQQVILQLFEQMDCGVYLKDELLRFTYVNEKFANYFNVSPENLIGKTIFDILDRDLAVQIEADEKRILETGAGETCEFNLAPGQSEENIFQVQTMCLSSGDDKTIAKIWFQMSGTERSKVAKTPHVGSQPLITEKEIAKPITNLTNEVPNKLIKTDQITKRRFVLFNNNASEREELSSMLASWNLDFAPCDNVDEALAVMLSVAEQELGLDGILVDYDTHQQSDINIIDVIKSDELLKDIPICLIVPEGKWLIGLINEHDLAVRIRKPVRSSELFKAISKLNSGSQTEPEIEGMPNAVVHADFQINLKQMLGANHPDKAQILIAEDNPVNQIAIAQLMEKQNYSFVIADDGAKALEIYEEGAPDLILMDMKMPQMDGPDAAAAIRIIEGQGKHTPIIGMGAAHEINTKSLKSGDLDDFITKPISPDELDMKLRVWMPKSVVGSKSAG